jgi:hypothetical protein
VQATEAPNGRKLAAANATQSCPMLTRSSSQRTTQEIKKLRAALAKTDTQKLKLAKIGAQKAQDKVKANFENQSASHKYSLALEKEKAGANEKKIKAQAKKQESLIKERVPAKERSDQGSSRGGQKEDAEKRKKEGTDCTASQRWQKKANNTRTLPRHKR